MTQNTAAVEVVNGLISGDMRIWTMFGIIAFSMVAAWALYLIGKRVYARLKGENEVKK